MPSANALFALHACARMNFLNQAIEERRQGLRAKEKEEMAQMVRENLPQHDNKQEQNEVRCPMCTDGCFTLVKAACTALKWTLAVKVHA